MKEHGEKKNIIIATAICAIIGLIGGFAGFIIMGVVGFLFSFFWPQLNKMSAKEDERKELKKERKSQKQADKFKCPKCGSHEIQPLGVHKKGFSVGKAVVGGAITPMGIGTVAGFAGKKTKKTDFVCMHCGKQFKM